MSYQVLARKWRPRLFREMMGQEHVLKALINALDHDRLHHAYLFTGTRGVGKTSIARILAKCLNCETGVSSEPCGTCSACVEIAEGRFVDLIEVDAASRTKVEDTRELLDNVQYSPTRGRYKVYLIDEVHMLSNHSFNALLKTLEEPPPHVKFLLATTDPQKLPPTILSRCLQFNLKNLSPERVVEHLKHVLEQEMVPFEEPALWSLGRAAQGSMRDAMSLTDQAIAFGSGKISESEVNAMLGSIDQGAVFEILEALQKLDGAALLAAVGKVAEHTPDYEALLDALLALLHRISIAQIVPDSLDNADGNRDKTLALAQSIAAEDVQLFYQMGLHGRQDLSLAPEMRSGLEMVLLRMLAFKPAGVPDVPTQNLPASASATAAPAGAPAAADSPAGDTAKKSEAAGASPAATMKAELAQGIAESAPEAETPAETETSKGVSDDVSSAVVDSVQTQGRAIEALQLAKEGSDSSGSEAPQDAGSSEESVDEPASEHQANGGKITAETSAPQSSHDTEASISLDALSPENWPLLYQQIDLAGVVKSVVSHCAYTGIRDGVLQFVLDADNASLFNDSYKRRIADSLSQYFSQTLDVDIQLGSPTAETPAQRMARIQAERQSEAEAAIEADENVLLLRQQFGASIVRGSIKAL